MNNDGILELISTLAAQRATGRVRISTGMTEGAVFFDRGQLMDVRLGKLTGFQAINALASVPDASYHFDPTIAPPAQSSITKSERLLLKDFFGIEAGEPQDANLDWIEEEPAQVVPLSSVENEPAGVAEDKDEVTLVRPEPVVAEPIFQPSRNGNSNSRFGPAIVLAVLTVLAVAAVIAVMYRVRQNDSTASVAPPTVQTPSQVDSPQEAQTAPVTNLRGNWKVVNTVEQSSYAAYKNMEIGFSVSINQAGKDFTGTGEKITENGRSLPAAGRTPITVKGTIDGDKVEATFTENGAVRQTNGRFVWRINKGNLTGTFVSTAARTRGKSAATKV